MSTMLGAGGPLSSISNKGRGGRSRQVEQFFSSAKTSTGPDTEGLNYLSLSSAEICTEDPSAQPEGAAAGSAMSDTDRAYLRAKLRSLTRSKSCIEDLSKWMLTRPASQVKVVVTLWLDELRSVNKDQLLPFLYLANAVMSNNRSRYKGPGGDGSGHQASSSSEGSSYKLFRKGFMKVMPYAAKLVAKDFSEEAQGRVIKLFGLWLCKRVAPRDQIENISKVYLDTWNKNQVTQPDEWDEEEIPLSLLNPDEDNDEENGGEIETIENVGAVTPPLSPESNYYPEGSPYEPVDSYEDDISKTDELKKFFECESCIQLNDLDAASLLSMIRSEPDMRRLFLQKVPPNSLLEVGLKPLDLERAGCPKERDLLALVESLCQLPSEDYDSRDMHNKFPDEFCIPEKAVQLCTDSWSSNEFGSSIRNALAILSIFLKRLDVEMGVRSNATWNLQAFIKTQKKKLFVAQDVLKEEQLIQMEMEEKLYALKNYVESLPTGTNTPPESPAKKLPSLEDLFLQTGIFDTKSDLDNLQLFE